MITKIIGVTFSPTHTGLHVTQAVTAAMAQTLQATAEIVNLTAPHMRQTPLIFDAQTLLVLTTPTYAGRVPNLIVPYLRTLQGNGALAIVTTMYGNRAYDDALQELADIATDGGCRVIGAMALVGEHSFSAKLSGGRPTADDLQQVRDYGQALASRLLAGEAVPTLTATLGQPAATRQYYKPTDHEGKPVNILKVKPMVTDAFAGTAAFVNVCPLGSIEMQDGKPVVTGICMKCNACIKACNPPAMAFLDDKYWFHVRCLEENFTAYRENRFF